jgi:hypothetical protein
MEITSIRERIFNKTKHESTVARASNPFAASTFKGNVLTADVFESSKAKDSQQITNLLTRKLTFSVLAGYNNNIGSKMNQAMESVVSFCGRMKENVVNTWQKLNDTNVMEALNSEVYNHNVRKMEAGNTTAKLGEMLQAEIANI